MNYTNILEQLLLEFPELKKSFEENDCIQDYPHCFFDIEFVPYIANACRNNKRARLSKIGVFLEKMAICEDEYVKELLNVSVLESLVLETNVIQELEKYLKTQTLKELVYWKKRYQSFVK